LSDGMRQDIMDGRLPLTYYVAIDPAISEKERSDYTAIIVVGMDNEHKLYLLDYFRERLDSREQIDHIFALYTKYRPEFVAIEKEKITKALGPFLREEMLKRNQFPMIIEVQPSKDLETRARSWQGRLRIGGVRFDKNHDLYPQYEAELTTFPRGVKDDFVAASAVMGLALDRILEAPTKDEEDAAAWDEEYRMTISGDSENGRSSTTGY